MRILLVRLREIGDVVFTTPAVRAIRRRFPDAHITYIVEPGASAIVEHNPHIDEVIVAPRPVGGAGFRSELALIRRLRAAAYDVAIDFHGGPRASLLTWLSGAPVRVGYSVVGRGWMYTRRIARPRELRARHSVENQWDLLAAFDIGAPDRVEDAVEMPLDDLTAAAVAQRLASAGVGSDHQLIVVHVSAGNPFRRWPIESFAVVAADLAGRDPMRRIAITAGPADRPAAERVIAQAQTLLGPDRGRVLTSGDFTLAELRALVDRAVLFIGGDSGPMHVAATSHVPIVTLYGPTLPVRSAPWRAPAWPAEPVEVADLACRPCDQRSCLPGDFRCLTWTPPQRVLEAAERALSRGKMTSGCSTPTPR